MTGQIVGAGCVVWGAGLICGSHVAVPGLHAITWTTLFGA